jgi:uncharacterized protein
MPRALPTLVAAALVAVAAGGARAAEPPPAPQRFVTDGVGFLSPRARDALEARLAAYERLRGHQVVVWIGDTLGGAPLDDFATRTFTAWQVGRKGHDDGVVLFLFARDRRVAIEVGYGLEEALPDARAARIIREVLAPRLAAGDPDGGITAAVDAILTAIEGRPIAGLGLPESPALEPQEEPPPSLPELLFFVVFGFIVLMLIVRNPHLAAILLSGMFRGGGRGGFGGGRGGFGGGRGGGGFRGGGGRSGGGGARGGW